MASRAFLLLALMATAASLAACAAQDGGAATPHSVVKRGLLDSIASGARSLRDGASQFFERSWSSVKSAFMDFVNWLRGMPSPDEGHEFRFATPPAPRRPEDTYTEEPESGFGFEPRHREQEDKPCRDSTAHPTVQPTTQGSAETESTPSRSTGFASTTAEASNEPTSETIASEPSSVSPTSVVITTSAPSIESTGVPEIAAPSTNGDQDVPQNTERAQDSTRVPSPPETTTGQTVSASVTRDVAEPTSTVDTPTPSIDATSSPTLPPEDPSENDIDGEPPNAPPPTPARRRGSGPGFVISDAH